MTKAGDKFVQFCTSLNNIPAAFSCIAIFVLQTAVMDYYLIEFVSANHWSWLGPDLMNLTLLIFSIASSYRALHRNHSRNHNYYSLGWISWLLMTVIVSAKTIVLFTTCASKLIEEDPSFFGPNTLKTAIALSSCVFFLLLTTQHDAPLDSERKRYIEELTGTVVFDLLDTVDILEVLFKGEKVAEFTLGFKETILVVAAMNLIIPSVPLLTLCKTKFGHDELDKRLIYLHRLLVVLVINIPNLLVRLILWHAFSGAISPFTLKNVILIGMTLYEFYQHKLEKVEERKHESMEMTNKTEKNGNRRESFNGEEPSRRKHSGVDFSLESRVVTNI